MATITVSGADADDGDDLVALSDDARAEVIREVIDLPRHNKARVYQTRDLRRMYGALMRQDRAFSRGNFYHRFDGAPSSQRDQGWYADFQRWWADRGRDDLLSLPGVSEDDEGGLRYVGFPRSEALELGIEDGDLRELESFRSDPRVIARNEIEDRHKPHSEDADQLLSLWDRVASSSPITSELISRDSRLDLDQYADELASLPYIERETEDVKASDIKLDDLDTLAELREAKKRVSEPPETRWRFVPSG